MIGRPVRKKSQGFTIIEIVSVLVILGILAATTVSVVGNMSTYQLTSQADTLKGYLRYAQMRAMNTDSVWGITFETNSYTISNSPDSSPVLPGTGSKTVTLPSGMTIPNGPQKVFFDGWGTPCTDDAGTTAQTGDPRSITLNYGGNTITIQIMNMTGYIP